MTRGLVALAVAGLLLTGCGGDDDADAEPSPSTTSTSSTTTTTTAPAPGTYTVVAGDTLSGIATKLGTTVEELVAANELTDPDRLQVGQVLTLPAGAGAG